MSERPDADPMTSLPAALPAQNAIHLNGLSYRTWVINAPFSRSNSLLLKSMHRSRSVPSEDQENKKEHGRVRAIEMEGLEQHPDASDIIRQRDRHASEWSV